MLTNIYLLVIWTNTNLQFRQIQLFEILTNIFCDAAWRQGHCAGSKLQTIFRWYNCKHALLTLSIQFKAEACRVKDRNQQLKKLIPLNIKMYFQSIVYGSVTLKMVYTKTSNQRSRPKFKTPFFVSVIGSVVSEISLFAHFYVKMLLRKPTLQFYFPDIQV